MEQQDSHPTQAKHLSLSMMYNRIINYNNDWWTNTSVVLLIKSAVTLKNCKRKTYLIKNTKLQKLINKLFEVTFEF